MASDTFSDGRLILGILSNADKTTESNGQNECNPLATSTPIKNTNGPLCELINMGHSNISSLTTDVDRFVNDVVKLEETGTQLVTSDCDVNEI